MTLALVPLLALAAAVIVCVPVFVNVALAADAIGQPAAGRQLGLGVGVGAAEINQTAEAGDGVVVGVLSRDGERERTPRHGRGRRPGDREVVERTRRDDGVGGAGSGGRVESRGNRLIADLRQRRWQRRGTGGQAAGGGQMCLAIAVGAAEADLSAKAGDRVVVHILSRDREGERMSRAAARRRSGDREMIERRRRNRDGVACACR